MGTAVLIPNQVPNVGGYVRVGTIPVTLDKGAERFSIQLPEKLPREINHQISGDATVPLNVFHLKVIRNAITGEAGVICEDMDQWNKLSSRFVGTAWKV